MSKVKYYAVTAAKSLLRKLNAVVQLKRLHPDARISFSGWGEDRIAAAWLQAHGVAPGAVRYLDIGASSPAFLSNTYYFYLEGGSGVLVEPDPDLVAALRANRPRDRVLPVGVTHDDRREGELTRLSSRVFNTISPEHANRALEQSKEWAPDQRQEVVDVIKVPLRGINEIMEEQFADGQFPHFISIDVEGLDFAILSSLHLARFQPLVICTEINAALESYQSLLGPSGYQLVCTTPDNYLFARKPR